MIIETINGHVLFPNLANYNARPRWTREWDVRVVSAVTSKESRSATRSRPRVGIEYKVTTNGVVETQALVERIISATLSAKACCPYWGRGGAVVDVPGSAQVVVLNSFTWLAGSYLFLSNGTEHEVAQVEAANLAGNWTLDLVDDLVLDWEAGAMAWPVLFGKFRAPEVRPVASQYSVNCTLAITEMNSARSEQIGVIEPDLGEGISHMTIADDFEVGLP